MKQVIEVSKDDFHAVLKEEMKSIQHELFFSKYENILVSTQVAISILGISRRTLYRLIQAKKISFSPHSIQEAYSFSLRTILEYKVHK